MVGGRDASHDFPSWFDDNDARRHATLLEKALAGLSPASAVSSSAGQAPVGAVDLRPLKALVGVKDVGGAWSPNSYAVEKVADLIRLGDKEMDEAAKTLQLLGKGDDNVAGCKANLEKALLSVNVMLADPDQPECLRVDLQRYASIYSEQLQWLNGEKMAAAVVEVRELLREEIRQHEEGVDFSRKYRRMMMFVGGRPPRTPL